MFTQKQYNLLKRSTRHLQIKVELLNKNNSVIDSLEGISISGSINIQADSAYRRNGDLTFAVQNNNLIPRPDSKIWFNYKLKLYIGLKDWNDETTWFNYGTFVIQNTDVKTSNDEHTISVTLTDLMANLDGTLNGNLLNEVKIVPEGVPVAEALRSTLSQLGLVMIDDILVNDINAVVPYEISVSANSTVYELVKTLLDLYMGMEINYDTNGILRVQKIRDRKNDPVIWDFTSSDMDLTIDYSNTFDFANIRNSIAVWGRKLNTGETIKWFYRNRFVRDTLALMNTITDKVKGDICYVISENKSYYWNESWILLSFNVNPEYSIQKIGEKKFAHTDEKIATIEQAQLRAEYELTKRGNFAETISINTIPLYGLDVNSKIRLNMPKSNVIGDYIVKSISVPLDIDSNMSITAEKLYF